MDRTVPSGVVLSRLRISGEIDMDTPLCVLEEILDSHRMGFQRGVIHPKYRESLISHIHKLPLIKLGRPLSSNDLKTLVTYINTDKSQRWTQSTLIRAYGFLDQFSKDVKDPLDLIPDKIVPGPQTPSGIDNLNACILYKICKAHNIIVHPYTNIETMGQAVKLLKGGPDLVYSLLSIFTRDSGCTDIINALVTDKIQDYELGELERVSYESLNEYRTSSPYINGANSPSELAGRILPISNSEAVGLAALIYKRDFSLSKCPISEFRKYTKNPHRYIPIDEGLREMFVINPGLIDLTTIFNPIFPQDYYDTEDLIDMALSEGHSLGEVTTSNVYELLQISYLLENFYEGLYPEIENEETPIAYDEVRELDPGLVICYGVRREKLVAFNIEELIDHFALIKTFVHPVQTHYTLSENAIRKLKSIATNDFEGTGQAVSMRVRLLEMMEEVEFLSNETNNKARQFYDLYSKSSLEIRTRTRLSVTGLLCIAMFMRGWKGENSPFPIREAPVDNQYEVDVAVTDSIFEFERICEELGDLGRNIMDLPLLKYQGSFNPITSEDHGLTIRDRLNIVKMGNETGNIQSCIRLTSNILAATAYRYMTLLGLDPPFPIAELRYIS